MKIDWFYLNSLAEANVVDMNSMFQSSQYNQNLGSVDLFGKNIKDMFTDSTYSMEDYIKDRTNYIERIKYEKDNAESIALEKEKNIIDESLKKDIEIDTIEMEF